MPLRIVFCGTPAFALPALRELIAEPDFVVEAVVTQPDRPRGRGGELASPPVKDLALEAGIAVYQPEKIRSESAHNFFHKVAPEVVVIIAYGQIIPASLIAIPRLGWVNLHASLLPKYRGAAPINWAIINGETRTGATTMQIDAGLDTGPMLLQRALEIGPDETAPELAARLADAGAPLVVETLRKLSSGEAIAQAQDESRATHAPMLKKEDGRIDWSLSAAAIYNRIRGLQPWPGAYSSFRGQKCAVWGKPAAKEPLAGAPGKMIVEGHDIFVVCGANSALRLEFVQMEGRKRISAGEFANGARLMPNDRFEI